PPTGASRLMSETILSEATTRKGLLLVLFPQSYSVGRGTSLRLGLFSIFPIESFSALRIWAVVPLAIARAVANASSSFIRLSAVGFLLLEIRNASISARRVLRLLASPIVRSRANCNRDSTASVYAFSLRTFLLAVALLIFNAA